MRTASLFVACVLALQSPAADDAPFKDLPEPSENVRKHLGPEVVAMLRRASKVEAVRVGKLDHLKAGEAGTVGARDATGGAVTVPRETAAKLVSAFLSENTYFQGDSKGTTTGVGFIIRTDRGETVEFSCCLVKGNTWLVAKDASGKVVAKGDRRGFRNDPDSPIRAIAAELFPDDADVQKLKPKKK